MKTERISNLSLTTITRERLTKILIETMALIKERSSRTGDSSGISTEVNAELFAEVTRIALASLTAQPVAWTDEQELRDVDESGIGYLFTVNPITPHADPRRVIKLYTALPAPVVPDEKRDEDGNTTSEFDHGWNACRAATLQGSQPVSNRDELPFEQWLSQQNEKIDVDCGCVTTEAFFHWLRVAYEAGNSPVIPDWQAKAEKLAELHGCSFVVFRNGESPQCADPSKVIISFTDEGLGHGAAAPQQEV